MTEKTTKPFFLARSVSCTRGKRKILDNLDLPALERGSLVAVCGPNGSGKSTLLRSLAGLLDARIRCLQLNGKQLHDQAVDARSNHLRYLPQSLPDRVHLTVTEAMLVAAKAHANAFSTRQALRLTEQVLTTLNIAPLCNQYLDELSGGQQQLVGIAQTLINPPEVLLLDEPLASLDLNYQHHVMRLLKTLCRRDNMLILVVMHDLNLALSYADTMLVLDQGRLAAHGPPEQTLSPHLLNSVFAVQGRIIHTQSAAAYLLVERPLPIDLTRP